MIIMKSPKNIQKSIRIFDCSGGIGKKFIVCKITDLEYKQYIINGYTDINILHNFDCYKIVSMPKSTYVNINKLDVRY